jgi:hydroxyacylglutathione hydrolase
MKILQIPALQDNYFYILVCERSKETLFIDPSDSKSCLQMVAKHGLLPKLIVSTHHHWDHVGANEDLKSEFGIEVAAPLEDKNRIPGFSYGLQDGDTVSFGDQSGVIIDTPGHTLNHISLYFKSAKSLFCGDTLFSVGCGRLFEGSAEQMVDSLYEKIMLLPDNTRIFCGHEYTESNLIFARMLEPTNIELKNYSRQVAALRHQGKPTIPTTLGQEKAVNPFLRCEVSSEIIANLSKRTDIPNKNRLAAFTAMRKLKDNF